MHFYDVLKNGLQYRCAQNHDKWRYYVTIGIPISVSPLPQFINIPETNHTGPRVMCRLDVMRLVFIGRKRPMHGNCFYWFDCYVNDVKAQDNANTRMDHL